MQSGAKPGPHALKAPFRADNWAKAKLVPLDAKMLSGSWHKLPAGEGLGKVFGDRLPELWEATKPGDKLSFRFKGTMVGLYDLMGPDGGQVVWTIDGVAGGPRPRFDSFCTYYRLASLGMAENLPDKEHTVMVEIHPKQPDRSSVVDRIRGEPGFDAKRFDGTKVWVGYLMMLGDPLPAGESKAAALPGRQVKVATMDLDRTILHTDFNVAKLEKLLAEHKGEIEQEQYLPSESWHVLRATTPGVRARDLCRQYQIEPLKDYRHRSREQINDARRTGKKI
jgi:hypothetical protein